MPQPLPRTVRSWTTGPEFVARNQPACVLRIGQSALHWTQTEDYVSNMIAAVLGRTSRDADGGRGINPNWIASVTMSQAETIRVRLKMANAILTRLLGSDPLLTEWTELSAQLFKRARERNLVVHTAWAWAEEVPDGLIQTGTQEWPLFWRASDFEAVIERIKHVTNTIWTFQGKVLDAIHDGRLVNYITPDMIIGPND